MRQLSQLIEQAKSQKGLEEIFNKSSLQAKGFSKAEGSLQAEGFSQADSAIAPNRPGYATQSLISQLDALEVELFPCTHLSSHEVREMIKTLESVLDDI